MCCPILRDLALCLSAALTMAACTAPPAETVQSPSPAAHTYSFPQGIGATAGIGATYDFHHGATGATDQARLAADGFRLVRFDLLWQEVEREPGVWDFSAYDVIVDDLIANGLEPLVLLLYGNPLYYDGNCPSLDGGTFTCLPTDVTPFYRYVSQAVAHFKGRVRLWEIWNEPNGWFRFWPTVVGGDPGAFAELLLHAARAVKAACADCQVISGGLVYLASPITMGQLAFMADMRAAVPEVFDEVDGIGFHAYTFYPPTDAPEAELDGDVQVPLDIALRSVSAACGCDKPLWVTETGWSVVAGLTEQVRAQFAVRGFLIALSQGSQSWLWWSLRKIFTQDDLIAGAEGHFGLLEPDGTATPAYEALRRTLALLGDAVGVTDVRAAYGLRAPYEWAVRFKWKDGREADVVWSAGRGTGRPIAELAGRPAVSLVDGSEGAFAFLGPSPVMIDR